MPQDTEPTDGRTDHTLPPASSLGERTDRMHVSPDVLLRAYREYARQVQAGYPESFELFLVNYTSSDLEIVVELGDRDIQEVVDEIQAVDVPDGRTIGTFSVASDDSRA